MYSLTVWYFLWLLYVVCFTQKYGIDVVAKQTDEIDYDNYNPLGHEYETGEDGVEQVKCADEFDDQGTIFCNLDLSSFNFLVTLAP